MQNPGIYCIYNTVTHRMYVGQSQNVGLRLAGHRSALEQGRHCVGAMQAEYIAGKMRFEVIEYTRDLNARERAWILFFDCLGPNGYNTTLSGVKRRKIDCVVKRLPRESKGKARLRQALRELRG